MLTTILIYGLMALISPAADPGTIAENDAIFLSRDEGATWQPFGSGLPEGATARKVLYHNDQIFLVTNNHGVFVRSHDLEPWQPLNAGLPEHIYLTSIAAVGDVMAVGSFEQGIYLSRDGGKHWQRPFFNVTGGSVRSLLFHEGNLLAGTDSGGFISSFGGYYWQRYGALRQVNDMFSHEGQIFAARQDGLVRSEDGGKTWSTLFSDHTVAEITLEDGVLYAQLLGNRDMFRSFDGGKTWNRRVRMFENRQAGSLTKALWSGYLPALPNGDRLFYARETPLGWIGSKSGGC